MPPDVEVCDLAGLFPSGEQTSQPPNRRTSASIDTPLAADVWASLRMWRPLPDAQLWGELGDVLLPHQPMDKQMVERLFGTTQWDVLNFRPGYTGSRPGELTGNEPKLSAKIQS
ncbi:hypothetical protein ACFSDD_00795 [Salipiger marinus]|uniref:hypothetical protein n=1 Tax=Salipiger marinus TaxID=555512 RepID=UPI001E5FF158|nr:hypothetical protein [Salipiger manganoxidans]MCD1620484.1 hypothetical protein [Salipiger manganoxidans]MEB3422164.1 hypothetical protein [Salipiger manganoxidans]